MTSRAPSAEGSIASWAQTWPLLFAIPVALFVGVYYLGPVEYHADDAKWLLAADAGLSGLWEPHPFNHFRPVFYAWIAGLQALRLTSPEALGFAGILLQLVSIWLVHLLAREWLPVRDASIAAAIFAIHPVRQTHWFWTSGHIDALCLGFAIAALILASRSMKATASVPMLVGIALTTLAAALSKETAFALPLAILLIPNATTWRTRLLVTAFAALGVGLAAISSAFVLDGGGRAATLLTQPNLRIGVRYCLRLMMPFDWFRFSQLYTGQDEARGMWYALALLLTLGTNGVVLLLVWFRRREPWTRIGFVLMAWGAVAWLFHEGPGGDRSIGVGAVGFAVILGGYAQGLSDRWAVTAVVLLSFLWAPRWFDYAEEWRAVDEVDRSLTGALRRMRSNVGEDPEIVVLGLPFTVGETGEPIDVDDVDPRARRALPVFFASPEATAPTFDFTYPNLTLTVEPPGVFGACDDAISFRRGELSQETIIRRTCRGTNLLDSVVIDTERLQAELGGAIPVVWTGTELLRLDHPTP